MLWCIFEALILKLPRIIETSCKLHNELAIGSLEGVALAALPLVIVKVQSPQAF
jgi:hypothetical protein